MSTRRRLAKCFAKRGLLGTLALALLAGMLLTGLWPFNFFASNHVTWDRHGRGLRFEPYAIAYSAAEVRLWPQGEDSGPASATVELKFRPAAKRTRHYSVIAAIGEYTAEPALAVVQSGTDLGVYVACRDCSQGLQRMWVDDLLSRPVDHLVTVSLGKSGTDIFVDGIPALHRPPANMVHDRRQGPIVLGNSPDGSFPWAGEVFGVAVYSRELSASERIVHARMWTSGEPQRIAQTPGLTAFMIFEQSREGNIFQDSSGSQTAILAPRRFRPVRRMLLRRYSLQALDWPDIIVNVVGFVPFAMVLFAYLHAWAATRSHAAIVTCLVGISASLVIEVLQIYLPSRDPSLLDVAANSLGTCVGVACSYALVRFSAAGLAVHRQ